MPRKNLGRGYKILQPTLLNHRIQPVRRLLLTKAGARLTDESIELNTIYG